LVCFKKSEIIKPNKEEEMILNFKLRDMARYSAKNAHYILDKGNYIIRVGNSSNNTKIYGYIRLEDNIIIEKLTNIVDAPDFKDYVPEKKIVYEKLSDYEEILLTKDDFDYNEVDYTYTYKVYNKLKKLSDTELVNLCLGDYNDNDRDPFNDRRLGLAGTTTKKIEGFKYQINMADGPAGLRLARIYGIDSKGIHRLSRDIIESNNYLHLAKKQKISLVKNKTDNIDYSKYSKIGYQYPTAIPIATALAQSFNLEYLERVGRMVGKEMKFYNVHLWLAPAMNIHRNILCGRNFEYFSEDPLVSGKAAAALVRGVQSFKNKGATVKHFAGNNQEFNRLNSNSKMSERALREIYLRGFKIALQESNPKALMTSYNLINGIHPSENELFLIDVLRSEWKYDGLVMTDWSHTGRKHFLVSKNPPQFAFEIIKGGNNLMMPGDKGDYDELIEKLNDKLLTRDDLLRCASKVYETILLLNK
jgi:beta-glucosidase